MSTVGLPKYHLLASMFFYRFNDVQFVLNLDDQLITNIHCMWHEESNKQTVRLQEAIKLCIYGACVSSLYPAQILFFFHIDHTLRPK